MRECTFCSILTRQHNCAIFRVISAGKTKLNEDQARAHMLFVQHRRRSSAQLTAGHPCPDDSDVIRSSLPPGNTAKLNHDDIEETLSASDIESLVSRG